LLAATGIIKGFNALFVAFGWISNVLVNAQTGTVESTYGIYALLKCDRRWFLRIFANLLRLYGNEKVWRNATALVHPTLVDIKALDPIMTVFQGTRLESPIQIEFLGIPVVLMTYTSSVIPIILATYFAEKVKKWLVKGNASGGKKLFCSTIHLVIDCPANILNYFIRVR